MPRSANEFACAAAASDSVKPVTATWPGTKRGRAGCLDCHDPHMSDQDNLLLKTSLDLCRECHESIVTSALAESGHYPAAEDCLNCHMPHASAQPALLSAPREELCRNCA